MGRSFEAIIIFSNIFLKKNPLTLTMRATLLPFILAILFHCTGIQLVQIWPTGNLRQR